jgi:hypothetical protein
MIAAGTKRPGSWTRTARLACAPRAPLGVALTS